MHLEDRSLGHTPNAGAPTLTRSSLVLKNNRTLQTNNCLSHKSVFYFILSKAMLDFFLNFGIIKENSNYSHMRMMVIRYVWLDMPYFCMCLITAYISSCSLFKDKKGDPMIYSVTI